MSSFSLKLLALVTMLIDHTGGILFPQVAVLRIIGRLAFPIYAFLLAQGCHFTHNMRKYLARLLLFAFISEIPYNLMSAGEPFFLGDQNVYFTLFLGGLGIYFYQRIKKKNHNVLLALLPSVGAIAAGQLLQVDYRFYGVALIIAFYVLNDWLGKAGFGTAGASRLVPLILVPFALFMAWWLGNTLFLYAMLAIIPLVFYNGKKGPALPKYLFYAFYPAHILILYWISLLIK